MGKAYYKACCHCGRMRTLENLSLDHILPRSKGGRLTKKNTALACKPCNVERGNEDFWLFRQRKRAEVLGLLIREVDISAEPPTRKEWERAHQYKMKLAKKVNDDEHSRWWLEWREPTPRDPL